jgi:hypothetical protein
LAKSEGDSEDSVAAWVAASPSTSSSIELLE